jgi:hypothetical protein
LLNSTILNPRCLIDISHRRKTAINEPLR